MQLEFIQVQTKEHFQAAADLTNTLYDNHVYSVEQSLHELANAHPPASFLHQLVYIDVRAVAYIECSEFESGRFWLDILVHPDFQRQGIGSKLMLEGLNHIQKFSGTHVEAQIRSDWRAHDNFYTKHGFERSTAWIKWWLKPENLNHQSNVQVKSLAEFDQPISNDSLLELFDDLQFVANQSESRKPFTLAMLQQEFGSIWFKPERFWMAFDQQNLVGASWVAGFKDDPTLFMQFLGVQTSAQSRGIGSAFVAKMVEVCQQDNFESIEAHTHPDETISNTFLEHRGFERRPGYLLVKKSLV
jgi:ribosomal protein S18 acetylase RimI-like enzyme